MNVSLNDTPKEDHAKINRLVIDVGSAIVLRVDNKLGSEAQTALLAYRKHYGEFPSHDYVIIMETGLEAGYEIDIVTGEIV